MYRAWEGKEEYAAKVRWSTNPEKIDDSDLFHMASSWASLTQSKPSEAARHLEQISKEMRQHPSIFFLARSVYLATQNWQMLLESSKQYSEWQPEECEGWALWAIALDKMGHTDESYALLSSVLDRFQNTFNFAYNFACFACRLGRQDEAWTWVQKAFRLTDLETFKQWLLTDDDLKPIREKITQLSQTRLI